MRATIPACPAPSGLIKRRANSAHPRLARACFSAILSAFLLATVSLVCIAQQVPASSTPSNTPATPAAQKPAQTPAPKPVQSRRKPTASHAVPVPAPAPVVPEPPKPPDWPVNDRPTAATVTWNSQGLSIQASNSSLQQILTDVSTLTGTKIQGLGADQRIYGTYGPSSARQILMQLFDGSGYNVLMIGDQGQGTPRQIVLSSQSGGAGGAARAPIRGQPERPGRRKRRRRRPAAAPARAPTTRSQRIRSRRTAPHSPADHAGNAATPTALQPAVLADVRLTVDRLSFEWPRLQLCRRGISL